MERVFIDRWVDRFDSVYDEARLVDIPWFTAAPGLKIIEAVVNGLIPRGSDVVDLGCGPGSDAVFLATVGAKVTAVDIAAGALKRARALADWAEVDVTFLQASVLNTGLPDSCADIVNDSFVFHNLRDEAREAYAAEVYRILRPGGIFLLNSFSDRMVDGTGPRRITSGEIFASFTPDRFECERFENYRNLPTPVRPNQFHWFAVYRSVGSA